MACCEASAFHINLPVLLTPVFQPAVCFPVFEIVWIVFIVICFPFKRYVAVSFEHEFCQVDHVKWYDQQFEFLSQVNAFMIKQHGSHFFIRVHQDKRVKGHSGRAFVKES